MDRCRDLNKKTMNKDGKYIAVWLKRDFRYEHNWAFVLASQLAKKHDLPIKVFVFLPKIFHEKKQRTKYCIPYPSRRHLDLLFDTWQSLEVSLHKHGIPLEYRTSTSPSLAFKTDYKDMMMMITDFKSTTPSMECDANISKTIPCKLVQVDAHNIVPTWIASDKAEYMARNFRAKLEKHKAKFLIKYPSYSYNQTNLFTINPIQKIQSNKLLQEHVTPKYNAGHMAALRKFSEFISKRLQIYDKRNDPTIDALSGLSIYINSGAISAQFIVQMLDSESYTPKLRRNVDKFIDEVWIRRELAENFCFYEKNYTKIESAWNWAKELIKKEGRTRQIYSEKQMEEANTDDRAWNAAQLEMIITGKMSGYMRMYWAKKISDWSSTRQKALNFANNLNDKYSMDGSDPNGYTGVGWAIIGIHDMSFYGKFRPMTLSGLNRKGIDIENYILQYLVESE